MTPFDRKPRSSLQTLGSAQIANTVSRDVRGPEPARRVNFDVFNSEDYVISS